MTPTGRFAPSPTGELHFGSLVAAVASCLNARSRQGRWLVRVEDIDPPRELPGSADSILFDLQRFGLRSDRPVVFQSRRRARHRAAVERLIDAGLAFHCGCSRRDLPPSGTYPGTCRNGIPQGRSPRTVRLRVEPGPIEFEDLIQGHTQEDLTETSGDFVIWRVDGLPAYQLAVVLDDADQGVTEVVRGYDLIGSTARQIQVARSLGLATPVYAHHPVALGANREKLSKRSQSDPIARVPTAQTLTRVLRFLGQDCPAGLGPGELWHWAVENWRLDLVPRVAEALA